VSARSFARTLDALAADFGVAARACDEAWTSLFDVDSGDAEPDGRVREDVRATVWELRRNLRIALEGTEHDVVGALNALAAHGHEVERAVVVWIELVETLVQAAERSYGRAPGRGALKAADVKAALEYLVHRHPLKLPGVPTAIEPFLVDVGIEWTIDVVVRIANRHDLWVVAPVRARSVRWHLTRIVRVLAKLLQPLWVPFVWLGGQLWYLTREARPLTPELRAALRAVEREGLDREPGRTLESVVQVVIWVGEHRPQVVAIMDLVSLAVEEAERYLELEGPQKKAYAHALVLAVLDELGFEERAGLLYAIVESFVDSGIDSVVRLFNKRGHFTHRQADLAATAFA